MFEIMDFDRDAEPYQQASGPIVPEAVDCMRCGICLSSCPTYQLSQDEQQGPRQRIRTLSQMLLEQQAVSVQAIESLNSCLQCRACEAVCPSQMDYSLLYDQAQNQLSADKKPGLYARLALKMIEHKGSLNALLPLLKLYRLSGLSTLLSKTGVLERLALSQVDKMAPVPSLSALKKYYPATAARGTVALFTGCVTDRFDRNTLLAAIKVLNHIGYQVLVPPHQGCCGAIHYHNGQQQGAKQMMEHNIAVFQNLDIDAIVFCASGCGSQLLDYQKILQTEQSSVQTFTDRLFEVTDFVDQHWPQSMSLKPCAEKAVVHEPCSHRYVLKNQQSFYRLLNRIPQLQVSELPDNKMCCGAGGSYMLSHPENAEALAAIKWQQIETMAAAYLLTTNIGCALHLSANNQQNKALAIIHPIELLASQL